jgi:NAD(P)-dependent dehydrogenase (short-subunit alcohol dehydrogenase family)
VGALSSVHTSIALVTGATGGIGKEVSRQWSSLGWTVLVGARDAKRGEEAATEIGGQSIVLDVTDPAGVAAAAASVPRLDVLVNNAGISVDTGSVVTEADIDVCRRTYETNVFGVLTVTNAFLPPLRRSAHPRIVNISSGTGSLTWSTGPNPQFDFQLASGRGAAYRSSKTALNALTVFYAQALAVTESRSTLSHRGCEPPISTPRRQPPEETRVRGPRAPSGLLCCQTTDRPDNCSPGMGLSCRGDD